MNFASVEQLSDESVLQGIPSAFGQERRGIAAGLALIAEAERRRLYRQAGCASMLSWCIRTLPLSEPAALNRIRAARVARRFPALLEAVADGRLHLGAVLLLARWLRPGNVEQWIALAARKSKREIQDLIREHITPPLAATPPPETRTKGPVLEGIVAPPNDQTAVAVHSSAEEQPQLIAARVADPPPAHETLGSPSRTLTRAKWRLRSPGVYELHLLCGQNAYDRVVLLHELLSHRFTEGEQALVIWHSIEVAIQVARKRRFAATNRPRVMGAPTPGSRGIPAAVRRAVWERDGGRCTFVAADGTRCTERKLIQFDHIIPVARGGESTIENLRLLCRVHNQFVAERLFGSTFMAEKRVRAS